jgi:hypothetical protein
MPIKPEATNSPTPTTGPKITLATGESIELSWQERALCAQTDPEAFFPEKGGSTREAKRVCLSCVFVQSVWNTHLHMTNVLEFGAGYQSANVVA